jgi:hypothetical protein
MPTNPSQPSSEPATRSRRWVRLTVASVIGLATVAYLAAIVLGFIPEGRRFDTTSIALLIVAGAAALLIVNPSAIEGLSSVTFGSFKAEFAQLRSEQEAQRRQVDSISAVLALLLTDTEQGYLLLLRQGQTHPLAGSHDLRTGLRKLRGMRLLEMTKEVAGNDKTVASITDGTSVALADYVSLTELGKRIVAELERIAREEGDRRLRD